MTEFPISGVETYWWLPAAVAFVIASITSTGGVTGAFILLPFQVSVLGYTSPGASPTNLLYNVIAIPSGVYRFWKQGRMLWNLAWLTSLATIPGLFLGAWIRVELLPDPRNFKLFAGLVLLLLAIKMLSDLARKNQSGAIPAQQVRVGATSWTLTQLTYEFNGEHYSMSALPFALLCLAVGVIGGIYGIGGGAILSPVLIAVYHFPVHAIAGAMLFSTFMASVFGILVYMLVSLAIDGSVMMPDWWLGLSFGLGGMAGVYLGATLQKYIPPRIIKILLVAALLFIAARYVIGFFS